MQLSLLTPESGFPGIESHGARVLREKSEASSSLKRQAQHWLKHHFHHSLFVKAVTSQTRFRRVEGKTLPVDGEGVSYAYEGGRT